MDDFAKCSVTTEQREQIYQCLPQFVFYKKTNKRAECYCTNCHSWYDDGEGLRAYQSIDNYKHNNYGCCLKCGKPVQFKAIHRGRKSYRYKQNFAVLFCVDDTVYIRCFLAEQYFCGDTFNPDYFEPDYYLTEVMRYSLRAGEAVQYRYHWRDGWKKASKPHEPVFQINPFGNLTNNGYTVINDYCLTKSFLRYHVTGLPGEISNNFITYLCCCAEHPNIEYLVKGGFWELAMAYVERKAGVHINWKSNNLLKMLRINRTELEFLKDGSASKYRDYVYFRRKIYKGKFADDTILHYELFCLNTEQLELIHSKTGLPFKQIMGYVRKQANAGRISVYHACLDYRDYIQECKELEYDMTDTAVVVPRSLHAAHERTSSIITATKNAAAAEKFAELNEERQKLLFTDEEKGLQIVLPESIQDIIDEGRKLSHCVGGYAERHADGKLHIVFLRKIDEPKKPYYTIEISTKGTIIQCRGFANNIIQRGGSLKPQVIRDFEQEYQEYLNTVFSEKKERKTA